MNGLLRIALKLLLNDKGKFATLVIGITFSVFLMMQMTSMFSGILYQSASNIVNVGAKMWVMDPAVQSPQNSIPMPTYVLDAVRSIPGVKFAVPFYVGAGLVKLNDGTYQSATIIGLDDASLFGRPTIISGNILDIYKNNAFIMVKDANYAKLGSPKIGTSFEINDHRAVVVALAHTPVSGLFGLPTLYTTYNRATQDLPSTRYLISYILVQPKSTRDIAAIEQQVKQLGYLALTDQQFITRNDRFYEFQTGMGTNILIMTLISFLVGLSIAGETFYMFVLDNLEHFGALKAIGAKSGELIQMIIFQSLVVGFLGFGFGVLLSSTMIAIGKMKIANYAAMVTYENLFLALIMVLIISAFSSYIGIRKVIRIDPFDVFRG
ncbi:MAG: ABC transporter permease [Acidithiobacillus sp.]|jgi:putative ABC transport system permease protein|uniref:ABC transporter permease n=1 Tax=Acidithiobacillus sp. TaxID=1872118 RepID=UPI00355D0862